MRYYSFLSLYLIIFVIILGCQPNTENGVEQTLFSTDFGNMVSRDFMGQIVDETYQPISGATITIGTSTTITDSKGIFILKEASVKERLAVIKISKSGFVDGIRSIIPLNSMNNLKVMLIKYNIINSITAGNTGEVTLLNGTKINCDGKFINNSGSLYSGTVKVSLVHLDPTNVNTPDAMPGILLGQNETSVMQALTTFGIGYINFEGSAGEKLILQNGFDITLPIVTAQQINAPETIPLWDFDTEKGHWVQDGNLTKDGNTYKGNISKSSWFNASISSPAIISKFIISDCNNQPLDNVKVSIDNQMESSSDFSYTNSLGETIGVLPSNGLIIVKVNAVANSCNSLLYSKTINAATESTNNLDIKIPCDTNLDTDIQGVANNCNGSPITNGYVWLEYGDRFLFTNLSNGTYRFKVRTCIKTATINTMQAVDLGSSTNSNQIQVTFKSGLVSVEPIAACQTITQPSVTDKDGNVYPLIQIGTQWWSQKNLEVTTYSDGTPIPQVSDPSKWAKPEDILSKDNPPKIVSVGTYGAWCYYNNETPNGTVYGKLYNWYAIAGIYDKASMLNPSLRKKLAPQGYHIPKDTEMVVLTDFLGGQIKAGGKLKSAGTSLWLTPNAEATNGSGFTAFPGGIRDSLGKYYYQKSSAYFISNSDYNPSKVNFLFLSFYDGSTNVAHFSKNGGFSVRFVKD